MLRSEINQTKLDLINWISQIKDVSILRLLESLRDSSLESDWWNELSPAQKEEIEKGLIDVEENRTLSSQDFWKKLKNAREKINKGNLE